MNKSFASTFALSLVAALAADAAVASSTTSSSTEKAPVPTSRLTLSNSTTPVFSGTTSFVRTSGTFYISSKSRLEAIPTQGVPGNTAPVQYTALTFDQKLEPITEIGATGIRRAPPQPVGLPEVESSSIR